MVVGRLTNKQTKNYNDDYDDEDLERNACSISIEKKKKYFFWNGIKQNMNDGLFVVVVNGGLPYNNHHPDHHQQQFKIRLIFIDCPSPFFFFHLNLMN